jgi:hypothetical protein
VAVRHVGDEFHGSSGVGLNAWTIHQCLGEFQKIRCPESIGLWTSAVAAK